MTNALRSGAAQGVEQISERGLRHRHAALSHIEVSKALLIIGMFMPKVLFAALFAAGLTGLSTAGVTSVARSQDARSCERATEKNRST